MMDLRRKARRLESQQKRTIPIGSKAEDTLKMFWMSSDDSDHVTLSASPPRSSAESLQDGSESEDSMVSGPSSPPAGLQCLRCRACERLFSKMKKQGPPRKKQDDDDPASLSCDEWLLNKTWRPQRHRKSRGRLWVHLKYIRLRAVKRSEDGIEDTASSRCSRPHVFLQRNLRRCKKRLRKPPKSRSRRLRQRRSSGKPTSAQRQIKRKSSEKDDAPEQLFSLDLSRTSGEKSLRHQDSRLEKAPKMQCVSSFTGTQAQVGDGARRVLKFVTNADHADPHPGDETAGGDFTSMNEDGSSNPDDDLFRTPPELLPMDLTTVRKSGMSRPFGARKDGFRAMLASLVHRQNQIFKETH